MAEEEKGSTAPAPMPVGKGLIMSVVAVVFVVGVSVLLIAFDLCIWVVWLGMCLWAAVGGLKIEAREIVRCWSSGAIGLAMGYLLTHGQAELGTWALVVAFAIVAVFIFGMVTHRWGWFCNNYTACFLTCCTAAGITLQPAQLALSIVFGFCLFGLVPLAAVSLASKRKKSDEVPAATE